MPNPGRPLPISLAFDVYIILEDEELEVGGLTCAAGSTKPEFDQDVHFDDLEYQEVFVVLKSNPAMAETTLEIDEIWEGELTLGPVMIGPE